MKRFIALAAITLGSSVAIAEKAGSTTEQIKLPLDAQLIGVEQVDEIRAFPELNSGQTTGGTVNTGNKSKTPPATKVAGVRAIDSVYTTSKAFKDTVNFLDKELEGPDLQPVVKTVTASAVGYSVSLPTGKVAHVVVRNTKPTTIETIEAVAATGEVMPKDNMKNESPTPSVPQ